MISDGKKTLSSKKEGAHLWYPLRRKHNCEEDIHLSICEEKAQPSLGLWPSFKFVTYLATFKFTLPNQEKSFL